MIGSYVEGNWKCSSSSFLLSSRITSSVSSDAEVERYLSSSRFSRNPNVLLSPACHCYTKIRPLPVRIFRPSDVETHWSLLEIFVGGLPYHTTDETLRKFFERFGEIEEAVVRSMVAFRTPVNPESLLGDHRSTNRQITRLRIRKSICVSRWDLFFLLEDNHYLVLSFACHQSEMFDR